MSWAVLETHMSISVIAAVLILAHLSYTNALPIQTLIHQVSMGSRIPSHQLSGGLYVSGRPEKAKERPSSFSSSSIPYTGGDVQLSGELAKMFPHIPPNPISRSGTIPRKTSGPIQPTGLITSESIGPRSSHTVSIPKYPSYGSSVTSLTHGPRFGLNVSWWACWAFFVVLVIGLLVGVFLMVSVKKPVILVGVGALLALVLVVVVWNWVWGKRGLLGFLDRYPDTELRGAEDGKHVKVTGTVTCGSISLESSYQRVPRCAYVSTELLEYRGCGGKAAKPKHRFFSWGCRYSEKHVADFYISDFQSGLRALVKAGSGAKVAPFVESSIVVDVTKGNQELSSRFLQWLAEHNLSKDDRLMRLKEGYIKEGSTVSVIGIVRRRDNVLMIVPPAEPICSDCQWYRFLFPTYIEGLVLTCDDNQNSDVVVV